jgi:hypothetical protein
MNVLPYSFFFLVFFCVGEGFSFLIQWHNNIIYILEVIDELYMNLALIELKLSLT